jgi:hypothetical protein
MTTNRRSLLLGVLAWAVAGSMLGSAFADDGSKEKRLFAFGVMADVQWADKDTRGSRHYRESLGKLEECVEELNGQDLAFTIQLGDVIDGNTTPEKTLSDLDRVLKVYNRLSMPKHHVVGNHCLAAGKEALREKLELSSFYYDFTVPSAEGWRFVVLDGNDAGYGLLGKKQLKWLESRLAHARANGERIILFNHFALIEKAARHHRMKTPEPVLRLINESGCVVAYFAGHDHAGGYALEDGIHHVTLKGMVEGPVGNAYAVIEVYPGKLKEVGHGREPSRELRLETR